MPRFASSSAFPAGDHALHSSVAGALCERTGPIDWSSARRARDAPIILGRRLVGRSADDQGNYAEQSRRTFADEPANYAYHARARTKKLCRSFLLQ